MANPKKELVVDLDALRTARAETRAEAGYTVKTITFGGKEFELPAELPYDYAYASALGDLKAAMKELLGEEQFVEFWKNSPSMDDMKEIAEAIAPHYGNKSEGESKASGSS